MKKLFTKKQINVMMLLNLVLVILFCGIIYMFYESPVADAGGNLIKPHHIIRDARLGTGNKIVYETNIGGSGNEQPVNVYTFNNLLYIFGNSDSKDLDFIGGSGAGFLAILSLEGKTQTFISFDFNIVKALPLENGNHFAVGGNKGSNAITVLLSADGTVIHTANLSAPHVLCDLFLYDNSIMTVTNIPNAVTKINSLMVTAYDKALAKKYERVFTRAYSLQYITILPEIRQGFVLVALVTGGNKSYMTFCPFNSLNVTTTFKDIELAYSYTTSQVVPYAEGYAALINHDNIPELLAVDFKYQKKHVQFLDCDRFENSALFGTGRNYYNFFVNGNLEPTLNKLSSDLIAHTAVAFTGAVSIDYFAATSKADYIAAKTDSSLKILALSEDGTVFTLTYGSAKENNAILLPLKDGILSVCSSGGVSTDVGDHFGGTDVWIAKLSFSEFL